MQRRDPEPSPMPHVVCYLCYCQTLTYATPSLLPVLLLLFRLGRRGGCKAEQSFLAFIPRNQFRVFKGGEMQQLQDLE